MQGDANARIRPRSMSVWSMNTGAAPFMGGRRMDPRVHKDRGGVEETGETQERRGSPIRTRGERREEPEPREVREAEPVQKLSREQVAAEDRALLRSHHTMVEARGKAQAERNAEYVPRAAPQHERVDPSSHASMRDEARRHQIEREKRSGFSREISELDKPEAVRTMRHKNGAGPEGGMNRARHSGIADIVEMRREDMVASQRAQRSGFGGRPPTRRGMRRMEDEEGGEEEDRAFAGLRGTVTRRQAPRGNSGRRGHAFDDGGDDGEDDEDMYHGRRGFSSGQRGGGKRRGGGRTARTTHEDEDDDAGAETERPFARTGAAFRHMGGGDAPHRHRGRGGFEDGGYDDGEDDGVATRTRGRRRGAGRSGRGGRVVAEDDGLDDADASMNAAFRRGRMRRGGGGEGGGRRAVAADDDTVDDAVQQGAPLWARSNLGRGRVRGTGRSRPGFVGDDMGEDGEEEDGGGIRMNNAFRGRRGMRGGARRYDVDENEDGGGDEEGDVTQRHRMRRSRTHGGRGRARAAHLDEDGYRDEDDGAPARTRIRGRGKGRVAADPFAEAQGDDGDDREEEQNVPVSARIHALLSRRGARRARPSAAGGEDEDEGVASDDEAPALRRRGGTRDRRALRVRAAEDADPFGGMQEDDVARNRAIMKRSKFAARPQRGQVGAEAPQLSEEDEEAPRSRRRSQVWASAFRRAAAGGGGGSGSGRGEGRGRNAPAIDEEDGVRGEEEELRQGPGRGGRMISRHARLEGRLRASGRR